MVRGKATAQIAGGPLPISELFSLGGADYGRAFLTASALGDHGAAGPLEICFIPRGLPLFLAGLELFAFADEVAAWFEPRGLGPSSEAHLASVGGGIRLPFGANTRLELAATNAIAADAPGARAGS